MLIDQARQNSTERLEVMFRHSVGGVLENVTPSGVTLSITRMYEGTRKLDTEALILASGVVNVAQPCYYDLSTSLTALIGIYKAKWVAQIDTQEIQHTQYYEVVTDKTRYCSVKDVLDGIKMDIPSDDDVTVFIKDIENEMDLYLKKTYITPIDMTSDDLTDEDKETINNIATRLCIGRIIRHYGRASGQLNENSEKDYDEAWKQLMKICDRKDGIELESIDKRAISAQRGVPKVSMSAPSGVKTGQGFFDDPNRMGSQNMWKSYP